MCVCECVCDVVLKFMCVRVGRVTMSTGACSSIANTHTDTDTHIGIQIHTDANVYRIYIDIYLHRDISCDIFLSLR
jgi:hypothetical protein